MKFSVTLLLSLIAIGVIVSACASAPQDAQQPLQDPAGTQQNNAMRGPGGNPGFGNYGNLTQEERQQMIATAMQQSAAACDSKTTGDACTVNGTRGNRTGTCQVQVDNQTQNSTLRCAFNRTGMRQRPPAQ